MLQTYEDLLAYLRREGAAFAAVRERHAVELTTHSPPVEGALVILWSPDPQLVQLIHPLPFPVSPERISAVEGSLLRVNHALTLPGFGFNYVNTTVYFRLVIPRHLDGALDEDELRRAVSTVMTTVRDFWHPLRAVILDGASPKDILTAAMGRHTS